MADPLSIIAGVVGVAATAAHAIHELVNLIDGIEGAPSTVRQIRTELSDVESVISSLENILKNDPENATWTRLLQSSQLSNAIKAMRGVCENFTRSLQKWTTHSSPGNKLSFRDGINVALHGDKISHLSAQLNSCKQTVTMALSSCALQGQIQNNHTTERLAELLTQEREATINFAEQRTAVEGLRSEEQQLQLVKTQAEDTGDIDDIEKAEDDLRDVSRARIAISQFATVSEYIAKSSTATRTNQDIGNITIAELGYGAVGMSNVDEVSNVKQKIGDVSVGSGGTGFIGIHGKVDHNAALAGRWTSGNKS
ncbi:hypothetical protein D6C84_08056 [Aureobasidium pullulans]|uniref:Azaphilone pigments biosynthesis cluster protein L N-terminal domain-containing protein n=1 Tax=Aureobasidium pullulans TaxID=5580 RepID=A0A4S9XJT4_AURPU|nr:hypothetical protein D6C84_08056 [Aureobasidium pullulans]